MLHSSKIDWHWFSRIEIGKHQHPVLFPVRFAYFLKEYSVVTRNLSWFFRCDLIVELAKHDFLVILEFLFSLICGFRICSDSSPDRKFDICDHFLAAWIVYRDLNHGFRICCCTRSQKLTIYLSWTFTEDAESPCDFAFNSCADGRLRRRIHFSDKQVLALSAYHLVSCRCLMGGLLCLIYSNKHSRKLISNV